MITLENKVAIVTGHARGIGKATFDLMTELGAEVTGFDLPDSDLTRFNQIEPMVDQVASKHGKLDILINNAGTTNFGSVVDTSMEEFDRIVDINLKAPFALMKACVPHMQKSGDGSIVNVASDQAFIGKRFSAIYGATKAALAQLSKSAALDWGADNIRINAIAPGSTDTEMLRKVFRELPKRYPELSVGSEDDYFQAIPLKRFADPKEIAQLIAFLASDAASFITGAVIPIDGGFTAQ